MKTSFVSLLLVLFVAANAFAATKVSVQSMTVDGLEVRSLECTLEGGGMFAIMEVVSTLSKQKRGLDSCAPNGAAFAIHWTWAGGKVEKAAVERSSAKPADACVLSQIQKAASNLKGTCTAVVLVGKPEAARKAADALTPAAPAPAGP